MLRELAECIARWRNGARPVTETTVQTTTIAKEPDPPQAHFNLLRESDNIPTELKFATYREGERCLRVAYAIFYGNRCVITATKRDGTSTINGGEWVAAVIARREGRALASLRFYDLQTHSGYGDIAGFYSNDGLFTFEEVVLEHCSTNCDAHIRSWELVECPPEVVRLFRQYIGDDPTQSMPRSVESEF